MRFRNLLSEIAHGRVVILSTHIVSDVEAVASQIAVIRDGRLVAHVDAGGAPAEGRRPRLHGRRPVRAPRRRRSSACTSPTSSAAPTASTCATSSNGNGESLPDARAIEPSLEDAYLMLNLEAGPSPKAAERPS